MNSCQSGHGCLTDTFRKYQKFLMRFGTWQIEYEEFAFILSAQHVVTIGYL